MNVVEAQNIFNYIMENRKRLEFKNEIDQLIKNDPFSTKNNIIIFSPQHCLLKYSLSLCSYAYAQPLLP